MGTLTRCLGQHRSTQGGLDAPTGPDCGHGPGLSLLENPQGTLWGGEEPRMRLLDKADLQQLTAGKILLFIHGMEYGCGHEVIKDFVRPFEKGAGIFEEGDRADVHCLFLHWNSCVFPARAAGLAKVLLKHLLRPWRLRQVVQEAVHNVETKASSAAETFANLVEPLICNPANPSPLIITHSMGAYLWAETVHTLVVRGKQLTNLGQWWSLQPALTWTALDREGEFEAVGALYSNDSFRKTIWYSSFDIVLATLYVVGKGRFAMGQLGARFLPVEQVNLALSAREAHGATCVGARSASYFSRVKTLIRNKVRDLALSSLRPGPSLPG